MYDIRMSIKPLLKTFGIGFSMGTSDIIPGVSGGTIAFIFGIYERLIAVIQHLATEFPKLLLQRKFKEAWESIPFSFLLPLAAGIGSAVLLLSHILESALHDYPVYVWSFFFGLVLASVFVVNKRIRKWNSKEIVSLVIGAVLTYFIVGLIPVETPATPLYFFLSGAIAICAMILPGISGAFILVLLGKYSQILSAVNDRDIATIVVVGLGCVLGLAVFSKLLHFLFSRFHDTVVAVLIGVMIGSLRKLWPWKEVLQTRLDSSGMEVPVIEANIFPSFGVELLVAALLIVAGMAAIIVISARSNETGE